MESYEDIFQILKTKLKLPLYLNKKNFSNNKIQKKLMHQTKTGIKIKFLFHYLNLNKFNNYLLIYFLNYINKIYDMFE